MSLPTLELWQTEWCPASHRVRQRLTELGLTYLVRQVPVEREDRTDLVRATGQESSPSSVPGEGMSRVGSSYTLSTITALPFDAAVARVREELATEGFGVLCEIDVQATLKAKLGVDRDSYLILGACNPPLAHRALEAEPELGTLLPCNVVVYTQEGETHIAAIDAEQMLSIVGTDELAGTAAEVRRRLSAVVDRVAGTSA